MPAWGCGWPFGTRWDGLPENDANSGKESEEVERLGPKVMAGTQKLQLPPSWRGMGGQVGQGGEDEEVRGEGMPFFKGSQPSSPPPAAGKGPGDRARLGPGAGPRLTLRTREGCELRISPGGNQGLLPLPPLPVHGPRDSLCVSMSVTTWNSPQSPPDGHSELLCGHTIILGCPIPSAPQKSCP